MRTHRLLSALALALLGGIKVVVADLPKILQE